MYIIGFTGMQGAGKSTSANFFKTFWPPRVEELHFATPIVEAVEHSFGIKIVDYNKQKADKIRKFGYDITLRGLMQKIGESWRKEFGGDVFVRIVDQKIKDSKATIFIIDDVRYPEEETYIKNNGGIIVRIARKAVEGVQERTTHSSEQHHQNFKARATISNDGTIDELYQKLLDGIYPLIPKDVFLKPYEGYVQTQVENMIIDTPV